VDNWTKKFTRCYQKESKVVGAFVPNLRNWAGCQEHGAASSQRY
jgi:hypothetical protein